MGNPTTPPGAGAPGTKKPKTRYWLGQERKGRPFTRSTALNGLFLIALVTALHFGREVLMPVALAVTVALVLRPIVRTLHRWHIPETLGAGVAVLGIVALAAAALINVYAPAMQWAERAPDTLREVGYRLRALQSQVRDVERAAAEVEKLTQMNEEKVPVVQVKGDGLKTTLARFTINAVATTMVLVVLIYFLLATRARLLHKALALFVEAAERPSRESIVTETEQNLSRYLLTISTKNAILGTAVGVSMWAWGMPNPVLWGAMAGMLNFIPYLGDLTGILITAIVAFVTFSDLRWLGVPLSYLVLTNLEGLLITPALLGRSFALDPVVVFLWLIFWGWLWGIGGALLAMPMLVTLRILSERSSSLSGIGMLISNQDAPRPKG